MVKLRPGSHEEDVALFLTFDDRWHADETLEIGSETEEVEVINFPWFCPELSPFSHLYDDISTPKKRFDFKAELEQVIQVWVDVKKQMLKLCFNLKWF